MLLNTNDIRIACETVMLLTADFDHAKPWDVQVRRGIDFNWHETIVDNKLRVELVFNEGTPNEGRLFAEGAGLELEPLRMLLTQKVLELAVNNASKIMTARNAEGKYA